MAKSLNEILRELGDNEVKCKRPRIGQKVASSGKLVEKQTPSGIFALFSKKKTDDVQESIKEDQLKWR